MAFDIFSTRSMMEMVESERYINSSFLRDRYFGNIVESPTEDVMLDIVDGNGYKLAAFAAPKNPGQTVERVGYTTRTFRPPEVSPDRVTTAEDLLVRQPGESLYQPLTGAERAARMLAKDLRELDLMIARREEAMCAEALFYGKVTVQGNGYDEEISYWDEDESKQPVTTLATKWTEAGSDPQADLRGVVRTATQLGGFKPVEIICGSAVIDALLANENFQNQLDLIRFNNGAIEPQDRGNGVIYYGRIRDVGLDIYEYTGFYDNDAGERVTYVPSDKALLAAADVRTTMAYGICSVIDDRSDRLEWFQGKRIPSSWIQRKNPQGRIVQIKSRPLPIIEQPLGFHVLNPI